MISYYLIPITIVLVSIGALVFQDGLDIDQHSSSLDFHVLADPRAEFEPARALSLARQRTPTEHFDTRRAEYPFWIVIPLGQVAPEQYFIEFPSRHAQSLACWNADTLEALGTADRRSVSGRVAAVKSGFAIDLRGLPGEPDALLCRSRHSGPAFIRANAWTVEGLREDEHVFQHGAGLLEGGLLTLALLTLVTAALNREPRYLLLAVWLVLNLRVGGLSAGWDVQWLGYTIPPEWMSFVRQLGIALYYLVTYALFSQLFRSDLKRVGFPRLLRAGQLSTLFVLVAAFLLPYAQFLPLMWGTVSFGIGVMIFLLIRVLIHRPSRTAGWYGAALAVVFFASFSEIIAAAFDFKLLLTTFNSVTAALASSGLVVMALAEQVRSEKQERIRAQEKLRRTYESTPVGLFTLDTEGHFLRINTTMKTMLGRTHQAPMGEHWRDYFETHSWNTLRRIAERGGEAEIRGKPSPNGTMPWYLVQGVRVGEHIEGSLQDITERVETLERLRYLADHDALTGALNRHYIENSLASAVADTSVYRRPLTLAYLDLDHFKLVNELYRDQAGDEVLQQITRRVQDVLDTNHLLGRLGGDEFLVVMNDTPISAAQGIGERILQVVNETPYRFGHQTFQVRVSVGLIEVIPGMSATDALATAERACREAKENRQQALVAYKSDAQIHEERARQLRLIKALDLPELPEGLYLVAQPILSLRRPYEFLNFEMLLRMRDEAGAEIPVGSVLAAAEASGNMARLDKWVFTQTLQWLERNLALLPKTRFVSVNVSGSSLNDQTFIREIMDVLEQYHTVLPHLCIEITEGVALRDFQFASEFIEHAKARGVSIALDDFGSGYTSFNYLRSLQADALKIDGSFIQSMSQHPANVAIVEGIVALTRNLGMRSIAEGVEDISTLETLAEIGADHIQGFVIARPQPLDTLLVADSSASYIKEPTLAELVRQLSDELNAPDGASSNRNH